MVIVPTTADGQSHWTQRTQLDGRDYLLTFDWQQRTGLWRCALADADGALIATLVLVTDYPLIDRCVDERRPPGELFLRDSRGTTQDCGFSGLGTRFVLAYLTTEELAELSA